MKHMKKQASSIIIYFGSLFFVIFLLFMVASSNIKETYTVDNINIVKSVETSRIKELNRFKKEIVPPIKILKIASIEELKNKKDEIIEFEGTLTGYGPDCPGCSGNLGCSPHPNVKNGNIYYDDATYGKIRILAADKSIPCGSIVKVHNFKHINGDFYGIVLDRGSAITGLTMDLLYESEAATKNIGRSYNITFKIERWGY